MVRVSSVMQNRQWILPDSILLALPVCAATPGRVTTNAGFRADTSLVLVSVGVTDEHNQLVVGLKPNDFRLFESGVRQEVKYFTSDDTPLSVGLVFDSSNSMTDKLSPARQATARFLQHTNPEDEVFMETFSDRPTIALDFSSQSSQAQNVTSVQAAQGRTTPES
jgi:Ca-activated chloride channel family protein